MTSAETGRAGEEAVAEYLRHEGYSILARNWRHGRDELDVVALRGEILHIVEVKTRHAGSLTPPEAAATRRKFRALTRAAASYIRLTHWTGDVQFDVAAVEMAADGSMHIEWIESAWEYNW
ncbi:YraN family protein [Alistipes sp.]|uniref:YraN family protein n=1 Tax=Alistipes sp. TaxID=1872444 RepID=UPI003A89A282